MLNVPPNREGRISDIDAERLREMGEAIRAIYANPVAPGSITAKTFLSDAPALNNILTNDTAVYRLTDGEYVMEFTFDKTARIRTIVISEDYVNYSERVEKVTVWAKYGNLWVKIGESNCMGAKTMFRVNNRVTDIRIVVEEARANPIVRYVGFYQ